MTARPPVPRETNPLVLLLARLARDIELREREAARRRRTIRTVPTEQGGNAA